MLRHIARATTSYRSDERDRSSSDGEPSPAEAGHHGPGPTVLTTLRRVLRREISASSRTIDGRALAPPLGHSPHD
jgi:hypothetical protein